MLPVRLQPADRPLRLPLRLPRGLHQHEAVAAVEQILSRAGWQVSSE